VLSFSVAAEVPRPRLTATGLRYGIPRPAPPALESALPFLATLAQLWIFAALIGLALVAHDLVPFAFGSKWEGVVQPLEVLSVYVAFRSIVALLPKVLTAVGNARFVMWNDLAALIILPSAFYIGSHWGTAGIAWGWVIAYPLVAVPLYGKTFKTIGMTMGEYLRALRPAIEATLVMVVATQLFKWSLHPGHSLLFRLGVEVAVAVTVYFGSLLLLHRARMLTFYRLAKSFRN
jgi:O-antigen/teichoic acid export membrane protein